MKQQITAKQRISTAFKNMLQLIQNLLHVVTTRHF